LSENIKFFMSRQISCLRCFVLARKKLLLKLSINRIECRMCYICMHNFQRFRLRGSYCELWHGNRIFIVIFLNLWIFCGTNFSLRRSSLKFYSKKAAQVGKNWFSFVIASLKENNLTRAAHCGQTTITSTLCLCDLTRRPSIGMMTALCYSG